MENTRIDGKCILSEFWWLINQNNVPKKEGNLFGIIYYWIKMK
jgi:hypothetical protein